MAIVAEVEASAATVEEVITSGTPALPCALSYPPFQGESFVHRVSPGTVVYSDLTSLSQFPVDYGYRPAALVLSTVVSHPFCGRNCCSSFCPNIFPPVLRSAAPEAFSPAFGRFRRAERLRGPRLA